MRAPGAGCHGLVPPPRRPPELLGGSWPGSLSARCASHGLPGADLGGPGCVPRGGQPLQHRLLTSVASRASRRTGHLGGLVRPRQTADKDRLRNLTVLRATSRGPLLAGKIRTATASGHTGALPSRQCALGDGSGRKPCQAPKVSCAGGSGSNPLAAGGSAPNPGGAKGSSVWGGGRAE